MLLKTENLTLDIRTLNVPHALQAVLYGTLVSIIIIKHAVVPVISQSGTLLIQFKKSMKLFNTDLFYYLNHCFLSLIYSLSLSTDRTH